ncbi:Rho-related GTP-binding protein RhoG [Entamoeba marina]
MIVDSQTINFDIRDAVGKEEYDKIRPLLCPDTDVFIICYSITDKVSYENVESKWKLKVEYHCPNIPIVLISIKNDIRENNEELNKLKNQGKNLITPEQGYALAEKIHA